MSVPRLRRRAAPAVPAAPAAHRRHLRTRTAAVVAWAAGAAALATLLYPAPAAALFAFLAGTVMVITMRTSLRGGLAAGVVAAVPFAFADLRLNALAGAGTSRETVAPLLVGLGLLAVSAAAAEAASAAISRMPAGRAWTGDGGPLPTASATGRDAGVRRAEWELARAVEYRRRVALALVGLDVPGGGDEAAARQCLMRELDDLVLDSVTRFDVVSEFGPCERLMVLPEESADTLVDGATQVCAMAAKRLGRPVRMALASFPAHGSTLGALLAELEVGLEACRASGVSVQVCRTTPARREPEPFAEPLLVLGREADPARPETGGTIMSA